MTPIPRITAESCERSWGHLGLSSYIPESMGVGGLHARTKHKHLYTKLIYLPPPKLCREVAVDLVAEADMLLFYNTCLIRIYYAQTPILT